MLLERRCKVNSSASMSVSGRRSSPATNGPGDAPLLACAREFLPAPDSPSSNGIRFCRARATLSAGPWIRRRGRARRSASCTGVPRAYVVRQLWWPRVAAACSAAANACLRSSHRVAVTDTSCSSVDHERRSNPSRWAAVVSREAVRAQSRFGRVPTPTGASVKQDAWCSRRGMSIAHGRMQRVHVRRSPEMSITPSVRPVGSRIGDAVREEVVALEEMLGAVHGDRCALRDRGADRVRAAPAAAPARSATARSARSTSASPIVCAACRRRRRGSPCCRSRASARAGTETGLACATQLPRCASERLHELRAMRARAVHARRAGAELPAAIQERQTTGSRSPSSGTPLFENRLRASREQLGCRRRRGIGEHLREGRGTGVQRSLQKTIGGRTIAKESVVSRRELISNGTTVPPAERVSRGKDSARTFPAAPAKAGRNRRGTRAPPWSTPMFTRRRTPVTRVHSGDERHALRQLNTPGAKVAFRRRTTSSAASS